MDAAQQDELKTKVAREALRYIPKSGVLGVGSGSTVVKFIEQIGINHIKIDAAVSSSEKTTRMLRDLGITVLDPNEVEGYGVYIDGADEVNPRFEMIKGGGACLTREKILASMAERFVCIVDESKLVDKLGAFPLPVEVIPMAKASVARIIRKVCGGRPVLREGCVTDNGCQILDVHDLDLADAKAAEDKINAIPGVVTVGLFAHRGADVVIYSGAGGIFTKARRLTDQA